MTTTMGETDIDLTILMDFEVVPPCDYNALGAECNLPVEWKAITPCCGQQWILCDPHHWNEEKEFDDVDVTHRCIKCAANIDHFIWQRI